MRTAMLLGLGVVALAGVRREPARDRRADRGRGEGDRDADDRGRRGGRPGDAAESRAGCA